MKEQKNNRSEWVNVRLTTQEFATVKDGFTQTTKRHFSEYVRSLLLSKPVTTKTRNVSIDALITELGALRMELKSIGNNLNQAVKKLHTLTDLKDIERWLTTWEKDKMAYLHSIDKIALHMDKINYQWLQ